MEITCLSKGSGFQFPPCHILNVGGWTVLIDCPLELSALRIFSPLPPSRGSKRRSKLPSGGGSDTGSEARKKMRIEDSLDGGSLIFEEPWYKSVASLHLWDPCLIDIVLISTTMGMLGLPYLTRVKGFYAKVYATEATARFGQLMMEDLVSVHSEFRQFYGSKESGFPQWMTWEMLELLPSSLREVACGEDGEELGGWMPLYSAADVSQCIQKVSMLKYGEETSFNGILVIKAFSSGSELGSCNWTLSGPDGNIAYLSCSTVASTYAMEFDYRVMEGKDVLLFSDFLSQSLVEDIGHNVSTSDDASTFRGQEVDWRHLDKHLVRNGKIEEAREKLAFIYACCLDTVVAGGSVLIPMYNLGTILQLLEHVVDSLATAGVKGEMKIFMANDESFYQAFMVPVYFISSVAEELLAVASIVPEWLCQEKQEKIFAGEPLFSYAEVRKEKKLHVYHAVHSRDLLANWQEPCIIFCFQWSLRLGPVPHLLRLWKGEPNSLLILEDGVDADISLLPFQPIKMKVLKCSFSSGMSMDNANFLLRQLQPRHIVFPDYLEKHKGISFRNLPSASVMYYAQSETFKVPSTRDKMELAISSDVVSQFNWRKVRKDGIDISRLEGQLSVYHGKHELLPRDKMPCSSRAVRSLFWGAPDKDDLLVALTNMGIKGSLEEIIADGETERADIIQICEPEKALIQIQATSTIVSASDADLATRIMNAIVNLLDGL